MKKILFTILCLISLYIPYIYISPIYTIDLIVEKQNYRVDRLLKIDNYIYTIINKIYFNNLTYHNLFLNTLYYDNENLQEVIRNLDNIDNEYQIIYLLVLHRNDIDRFSTIKKIDSIMLNHNYNNYFNSSYCYLYNNMKNLKDKDFFDRIKLKTNYDYNKCKIKHLPGAIPGNFFHDKDEYLDIYS